jgi:hypothetical protein
MRLRSAELYGLLSGGMLDRYVRVELALDALRIAHDHPYLGTGPATFVFVHPRYQSSTFLRKAVLTHDDYLNCLDDYGLVGFGLAMFFVAAVTLKFFQPLWLDHRWADRVLVGTGFAAWSALLIHSFVDFNMHIPANARLLFALTGLALSRVRDEDEVRPHWSTLPVAPLRIGLAAALVLMSLAYGAEVLRTAASDIPYEQAYQRAEEVPISDSIAAANSALRFDSGNAQDLIFLGDLHRFSASREKEMEGRLREGGLALDAYRRALKASSLDDTIWAKMGLTFDLMRRFPEAYFCFEKAATAQPYNGQFWYRLGNHYWQCGMFKKAEEAFLLSEHCPFGFEESGEAEQELRQLPELEDVPLPPPGTNPLTTPDLPDAPAIP